MSHYCNPVPNEPCLDCVREEVLALVVAYCEEHAERDSVFLYPAGQRAWRIDAVALLDYLHDALGVQKPEPQPETPAAYRQEDYEEPPTLDEKIGVLEFQELVKRRDPK